MSFELILILLTLSALLFMISDVQKLKRKNKSLQEDTRDLKKEIEELQDKLE